MKFFFISLTLFLLAACNDSSNSNNSVDDTDLVSSCSSNPPKAQQVSILDYAVQLGIYDDQGFREVEDRALTTTEQLAIRLAARTEVVDLVTSADPSFLSFSLFSSAFACSPIFNDLDQAGYHLESISISGSPDWSNAFTSEQEWNAFFNVIEHNGSPSAVDVLSFTNDRPSPPYSIVLQPQDEPSTSTFFQFNITLRMTNGDSYEVTTNHINLISP